MREALRPLEGALVIAKGRILQKNLRHDLPDTVDVLLGSVSIYRWDGTSVVDAHTRPEPDAKAEHLWLRMPAEGCEGSELLSKTFVFGRVGWYARARGDIDLGITALVAHDLDCFYWSIYDLMEEAHRYGLAPLRAAVEALDVAITRCEHQGADAYVFSRHHSIPDCTRRLTRLRVKLLQTIEATASRLATATANGPCQKLRAADPFAALRRRNRKAVA